MHHVLTTEGSVKFGKPYAAAYEKADISCSSEPGGPPVALMEDLMVSLRAAMLGIYQQSCVIMPLHLGSVPCHFQSF